MVLSDIQTGTSCLSAGRGVKPEPGPRCRTTQGFCLGAHIAFQGLFTALISSDKKIPAYCMSPIGSCVLFLSHKWQMLELVIQRGFIFSLPGDKQL